MNRFRRLSRYSFYIGLVLLIVVVIQAGVSLRPPGLLFPAAMILPYIALELYSGYQRGLNEDARALAIGISEFAAMLAITAFLYILFDAAMNTFFPAVLDKAGTTQATEQIELAQQIWGAILFVPIAIALLFIIARSVRESRTP